MIVLEFMNNGDMKNYLHTLQPQYVTHTIIVIVISYIYRPGELVPTTVPSLLLSFCRQIASGIEYLSKKSFVHRDLAPRNILVAEGDMCKVCDAFSQSNCYQSIIFKRYLILDCLEIYKMKTIIFQREVKFLSNGRLLK